MRNTLSTNGEHLRVAEVKSFLAIPRSMRSVNGDRNGANFKKWSVLLVCTILVRVRASVSENKQFIVHSLRKATDLKLLPLQKFSWVFEFSWESHEILMRISWDSHEKMTFSWEFSNSHENLSRGFLLMRISFFSWELKAHKNLVRFSWDSHEKMTFSWDFLMSFFYWWESHFSHERWKLMRVSWDSHEKTLSQKLCFCFFSWLYRVIDDLHKHW